MPVHDLVDTNKDRCIDTVFEYVNGVLVSAQQFRESEQTGNREIVSFEYEYGIHVHENHEPTDLDPCEFHAEVMGRMPSTPSMAR
jgi:hypothetical protein